MSPSVLDQRPYFTDASSALPTGYRESRKPSCSPVSPCRMALQLSEGVRPRN